MPDTADHPDPSHHLLAATVSTMERPRRIGRAYAVVALAEAITWAGLLLGMFLKYVTESTELGVWLFGRLHGGVFLVYVVVTIVAAVRLRWSVGTSLLALTAAIPPLFTWPMERWLRRTGRLGR